MLDKKDNDQSFYEGMSRLDEKYLLPAPLKILSSAPLAGAKFFSRVLLMRLINKEEEEEFIEKDEEFGEIIVIILLSIISMLAFIVLYTLYKIYKCISDFF